MLKRAVWGVQCTGATAEGIGNKQHDAQGRGCCQDGHPSSERPSPRRSEGGGMPARAGGRHGRRRTNTCAAASRPARRPPASHSVHPTVQASAWHGRDRHQPTSRKPTSRYAAHSAVKQTQRVAGSARSLHVSVDRGGEGGREASAAGGGGRAARLAHQLLLQEAGGQHNNVHRHLDIQRRAPDAAGRSEGCRQAGR